MPGFMEAALDEARKAGERGEVPIGAVVVANAQIIARDGNRTLELHDPTAHAEILVLRQAGERLGTERLIDCDLYVTLEPCAMCAAASSFGRIRRLYYGAEDPKGGAVEHGVGFFGDPSCHHAPDVYSGIRARESAQLLRDFFSMRR